MLFEPALAQGQAPAGGGLISFLPIILIFVIFYFLLIRPQQRKMKQHQEMVSAVVKGDEVLTGGGIFGKVSKVVDETQVLVKIAQDVEVKIAKATITDVIKKKDAPQEPAKK